LQAEIRARTGLRRFGWRGAHKSGRLHRFTAGAPARLSHDRARRRRKFPDALPVEKLHGIGHVQRERSPNAALPPSANCARCPSPRCRLPSAKAIGQQIWERARGLDGREVLLPSTPKSVSRETTMKAATIDTEFLGGLIEYLSERIGSTLREYGKQARTIACASAMSITFRRTRRCESANQPTTSRELLAAAKDLFSKLFTAPRGRPPGRRQA